MSFCFDFLSVVTEVRTRLAVLWRQLRAPFRPAAIQYKAPGLRCHARSKTVCTCPLDSAGLERAFHLSLVLDDYRNFQILNLKITTQKEGRQGYAREKIVSIE